MAISWAEDPPRANRLPYIPLRRLPPATYWRLALTCSRPLACWCHYLGGRTLPCVDRDCPGCSIDRRRFRECYLSGVIGGKKEHVITVLTESAEVQLRDLAPDPDNLRGVVIDITRQGQRANGRITVAYADEAVPNHVLPKAPDLRLHLLNTWGLLGDQMGSDHPLWAVRDQLLSSFAEGNGNGQTH